MQLNFERSRVQCVHKARNSASTGLGMCIHVQLLLSHDWMEVLKIVPYTQRHSLEQYNNTENCRLAGIKDLYIVGHEKLVDHGKLDYRNIPRKSPWALN